MICVRIEPAHATLPEKRDSGVARSGQTVRRKVFPVRSLAALEQGQYFLTVFICVCLCKRSSLDSSVGIATGLLTGEPGDRLPVETKMFLVSETFRPPLGPTQPSTKWVPWLFPELKRPGLEVKHSLPYSVEDENEWSYTFTPHMCLPLSEYYGRI